ncbi:FAD-binding oxidoreductase [Gemella sp. zg-1178]|uniref:NAD(P)/FAD-dependent oxidoreductase n=1 Tax=Gemella sp. zg-1178 TaxID=2840372 RepID=UPI001C04CC54|nr:FAD-dependent oxidoreductase [Gemella sp. zg-1178]MBU0278459.1 FAD-binding oxidoreductase [Gemella sp. zg-1178]
MKIAVVGAGIVGATCAYYLSKEDVELKVFDYGLGQATKASAGIISPWFSKRRNKAWYKMARLGAEFYLKLVKDLKNDGYSTDFYRQTGVYILKKDESKLQDLLSLAESRREVSAMIGDLKIVSKADIKKNIPDFTGTNYALYASGGGRIEGELFVKTLLEAANVEVINKKVSLEIQQDKYIIDNEEFDKVILCTGAWLKEILEPLNFEIDVRPQKGQLRDYQISDFNSGTYSVIMPEGELDIIPFENGFVSMGATHENNMGFDLRVDKDLLNKFEEEATNFLPTLKKAKVINERVGIRAYTNDFSAFYGLVPGEKNLFVASGLGSSGLTTGGIIAYNLAMLAVGKEELLDSSDYPTSRYIRKK